MRFDKVTLVGLVLAAMLPATQALAQDDGALLREGLFKRDRNVSVSERPKPEYNPITMHFGSFSVLPSITVPVIVRSFLMPSSGTGITKLQMTIVQNKGAKAPVWVDQNTAISEGSFPYQVVSRSETMK